MDYMNYTCAVINENSEEALASLTYSGKDGEETVYHPIFRIDEIKKVYQDFNLDEIEGISIDFKDYYAIATIRIAQDQGNILMVWDIEDDQLMHLTRCPYAEKSVISGCWIYTLCDVGCYGVKRHLMITKTRFEEMDIFNEGEILDFRVDPEYSSGYNRDDFFIRETGDEIEAGYKGFAGRCKK